MHTLEIPEKNISIDFPSHLGECNEAQYINMCELIFKELSNEITFEELKNHAVYYLLNMVPGKQLDEDTEAEKFSNINALSNLVESFFDYEEENNVKIIKQYYIHNPIYKVRGVKNYYGPSDEFNNVKFGEYVDALSHFADFNQTGETKYLYYLMATFYREKRTPFTNLEKYKSDKRIKYNTDRVSELAATFKTQPMGVVYGFYLLFASFQKYLTTAKLFIQGVEIDLAILFNSDDTFESDVPGIGMKSTLYTIAESGIFGTKKEVEETPLWEILIRMYDIKKRDLDAKALAESKQK